MNREEILDRILYSHYLEKMFSTLTSRIDKLLSFLSLLLGSSVIAELGSPIGAGIAIATITALQMAYQYGKSSEHSRKQAKLYQALYTSAFRLTDEELFDQMLNIEDGDFTPWMILNNPAMLRTRIHQNISPDELEPTLSLTERTASWLAGDLPKRPTSNIGS